VLFTSSTCLTIACAFDSDQVHLNTANAEIDRLQVHALKVFSCVTREKLVGSGIAKWKWDC
jgi:hypothetical protein